MYLEEKWKYFDPKIQFTLKLGWKRSVTSYDALTDHLNCRNVLTWVTGMLATPCGCPGRAMETTLVCLPVSSLNVCNGRWWEAMALYYPNSTPILTLSYHCPIVTKLNPILHWSYLSYPTISCSNLSLPCCRGKMSRFQEKDMPTFRQLMAYEIVVGGFVDH